MTQDERWMERYKEVTDFIETNHRNPSKYDAEERGDYYTWLKANRKALNAGKMMPEGMMPEGQVSGISLSNSFEEER